MKMKGPIFNLERLSNGTMAVVSSFDFDFVQLTHTYTVGIRRNDQSLFHYGFLQEYDPPALVEQDLPDGNLYDVSSYSEADYGETPHAMSVSLDKRSYSLVFATGLAGSDSAVAGGMQKSIT